MKAFSIIKILACLGLVIVSVWSVKILMADMDYDSAGTYAADSSSIEAGSTSFSMRKTIDTLASRVRLAFGGSTAPEIAIGDSKEMVLQNLGEPLGQAITGDLVTLFYAGGGIELKDGWVIEIEAGFVEKSRKHVLRQRMEAKQRAKGLVEYNGSWIPIEEAKRLEAHAKRVKASQNRAPARISRSGTASVPVRRVLVLQSPNTTSKPKPKKLSSVSHGLQ